MTPGLNHIVAPVILMALLATTSVVAADQDFADEGKDAVDTGKSLADTAITAAVEDAIEAVLANLRIELDSRFNGRTSLATGDGP